MPEAEIRRRGGAVRVRTIRTHGGGYRHIYVVRDAGPRGGHTLAGEEHKSKSKPKVYVAPHYRMKPNVPKWKGKKPDGKK